MRIEQDIKLDYKDVLIRPKRSTLGSRQEVDLFRKFKFRNYTPPFEHENWEEYQYNGIPIMAANMDGVGTFAMADTLAHEGMFTCLVKTYSAEELISFFNADEYYRTQRVAYSMGITQADYDKFASVYKETLTNIKYVCVDVANGYSERFATYIRKLREAYPEIVIIAGNVVTGEMTEELILSGADIIKVGIGPGSVCTTRIQTGVGYPQLSAVMECSDAAHGLGGHIIADGGCTCPGDVAKAFAAGADFVMLGSLLSGTNQGGGEIVTRLYETDELQARQRTLTDGQSEWTWSGRKVEEKKFVQFYGMSSETANDKHFGGLKDYRSSEGRTVLVPYKGEVNGVVQDILGGLRSAMTYCGAVKLKDLSKCATFVRCTQTHNSIYENSTIGR
jgi:GMP reductase